eukprot:gnl/TRDRNA2_/TRDRNA2_147370_c0_seq1.p1 gnl/TRDRNA2_/TRDRNA2_147370_c0~~gnl/TRDRNA2_/TRDRNA2_147370_c0_seq1.p1  ORF type:complete len:150 (-),score=9.14 gnl/TRDRNA2_/TRDRNA2_147370_c0_seq1:145-594(-)
MCCSTLTASRPKSFTLDCSAFGNIYAVFASSRPSKTPSCRPAAVATTPNSSFDMLTSHQSSRPIVANDNVALASCYLVHSPAYRPDPLVSSLAADDTSDWPASLLVLPYNAPRLAVANDHAMVVRLRALRSPTRDCAALASTASSTVSV